MAYQARIYRILIASPSDTRRYREEARRVMEDWTALNSEAVGVALVPLLWERDAMPESGDRPQAIINRQVVAKADGVLAIFWTQLGTPTGEGESGTAEEIEECLEAGKPALLYFSTQPVVPGSVDTEQMERLREYKEEMRNRALYREFADENELAESLFAALTHLARERFGADSLDERTVNRTGPGADPIATIEREREMSGFTRSGSPRYRTNYSLEITNHGSAVAEDFRFRFEPPSGAEDVDPNALLQVFDEEPQISRLAPASPIRFPLRVHLGVAPQAELVMTWREGDETHERGQTLRI